MPFVLPILFRDMQTVVHSLVSRGYPFGLIVYKSPMGPIVDNYPINSKVDKYPFLMKTEIFWNNSINYKIEISLYPK